MPRSNLALLYEDRLPFATLDGGGWQPGSLGLENLKTPYLAQVARSLSADPADTRFTITLPRTYIIGGFALGPTSLRPTAQVRIRAYLDAGMTQLVDDSGFLRFPGGIVDSLSLEWEDAGFWEGITAEFDDLGKGGTFFYLPRSRIAARHLLIEIFDPGHPAGFVEVSRLIMGRVWRPARNYAASDNGLDFEPITDQEQGRTGVDFFNPRALKRVFRFGFPALPDESFRDVYQIAVRSGIHNQVAVIPNPSDPDSYLREAFIGTLGQVPSLRRLGSPHIATNFIVRESL